MFRTAKTVALRVSVRAPAWEHVRKEVTISISLRRLTVRCTAGVQNSSFGILISMGTILLLNDE
jgi:hypothetical protein